MRAPVRWCAQHGSYAGGGYIASEREESCIARWNGMECSLVGHGFHGPYAQVAALMVFDNALYAAGHFTMAGDRRRATLNGTHWSAIGAGVGDYVYSLAVYNDALYVGGALYCAGGLATDGLARWNGTHWSSSESGIKLWGPTWSIMLIGTVRALAVHETGAYIWGELIIAGGVDAVNVAR